MSALTAPVRQRVVVVLVVSDGVEELGGVLATIAGASYPDLDLVVVDNATRDGAAEVLDRRIPPERLVRLRRRVGFGRAVAEALRNDAVAAADLVLLHHDDLVLEPDAIAELVAAMDADAALGVVGPKLRDWGDEGLLREVGVTIDRLGRAETLLELGELDQGQHDRQREVLYVSTAGMLVRREVLRAVGAFDIRYDLLRDDLDLCWRTWLAGHRVAVVPAAVGYHVAAASRLLRPVGRGHSWTPRELAERNTFATLLKCYGWARLAWVAPVVLLLALAKVLAFLATRRFGDALATARAYAWNLAQLPRTLRRRRQVQRRREVSDGDLSGLFAPGLPRVRAYAEALGGWVAGGGTRALYDEADAPTVDVIDPLADRPVARVLRDHPAAAAGVALAIVYLVGLVPLLGGGQLTGGEVAPWPARASDFLRAYASPWNGEPAASAALPSPVQALLGVVSVLGLGSAWLAQRLVVLGLLPVAWCLALRAGRLVTSRPGPRVLGATVYALSPVLMTALALGRFSELVAAALLPGLLLVGARSADPALPAASAWRAAALLSLGLAVVAGASPVLGIVVVVVVLAAAAAVRRRSPTGAVRLAVAAVGALVVLAPWAWGLLASGQLVTSAPPIVLPLWRALALAPVPIEGFGGVAAVLAALLPVGILVLALLLGLRHRPGAVAALIAVHAASALAAWLLARGGARIMWPPALLIPGALAAAGLAVVSARWVLPGLRAVAFGVRQVVVVIATVAVAVGLLEVGLRLGGGPWDGLARDVAVVPPFVAADEPRVGPYRVLLLADRGGEVAWDLIAAGGRSMVEYGTVPAAALLSAVEDAVGAAAGGADVAAGDRLGLVGVRYVVVRSDGATDALRGALARQPALEPVPSGEGRVYRVRSWLPRAVVLPQATADALRGSATLGDATALEERGLTRLSPSRYAGAATEPGLLVLGEAPSSSWRATAGGAALQRAELPAAVSRGINAFELASPADVVELAVDPTGRRVILVVQALVVLVIVSLALRPPGTRQRAGTRGPGRALPSRVAAGTAPGYGRGDVADGVATPGDDPDAGRDQPDLDIPAEERDVAGPDIVAVRRVREEPSP